MHSFTQSLRYQMRETAVKIIELEPPAVQVGPTLPYHYTQAAAHGT